MKLGGKSGGGNRGGIGEEGMNGGFGQNTLCSCMKVSNNNKKGD